jgi:Protein of unknown function (DUF3089)
MTRRFLISLTFFCAYASSIFAQSQPPTPSPSQDTAKPAAPAKNDYSNPDDWLCLPGRHDACFADLSTTVISAEGKLTLEPWAADPNASIDCFYVYPTVSKVRAGNSDMIARMEEKEVALRQFARFGSKCRLYAPIYRQVTITALRAAVIGVPLPVDRVLAYSDVVDAWNYYLAHDNHGRGVVLIGHSQGANILTALIKNEIEGKPIQSQIISALLLGTSLPVPKGKDVGGVFKSMPLCRAATQIGCIITYSSFRATSPPPANSRFGKVAGENMVAGCTNPAALAGGSGDLHAYLGVHGSGVSTDEAEPAPWVSPPQPINTSFVSVPGMLSAECVSDANGSYLAITIHADPAGPRTSEISGDVVVNGRIFPDWGLHLIDVHLAMGNLLDIVAQQTKSYLRSH